MSNEDEKPVTPIAYDTAGIAAAMKARQKEEALSAQYPEAVRVLSSVERTCYRSLPSQVFPGAPRGPSMFPKPAKSALDECSVDEVVMALHADAYQFSLQNQLTVRVVVTMLRAKGYVIARKTDSNG